MKMKVAQAAECARAAELRAQVAKHTALEQAARRDARAHTHKLLEEIKSKERVIIQLKREAARASNDQGQKINTTLSSAVAVRCTGLIDPEFRPIPVAAECARA
ncbi:unnamed protein product [Danaus chrysippus]|uniref:(African queen) hypothetical protein n=1 Tax=Danaus chrysippus TaxID=151541 RepID=A0A8J2QH78_9NEOP|nr:unnamed protein product [Danaus chrysippus]